MHPFWWYVLAQSGAPASRVALAVADARPLVLSPALGKGVFVYRFGIELASVFRHVTNEGELLWAFRGG